MFSENMKILWFYINRLCRPVTHDLWFGARGHTLYGIVVGGI